MAAAGGDASAAVKAAAPVPDQGPPSALVRLFAEGYTFDFFQAVRLLEQLAPDRRRVGRGWRA